MHIKSLSYSQFDGTKSKWEFTELSLKDINLIVGKNAVGKSKVLNALNGLALILGSGTKLNFANGNYDVKFDFEGEEIRYILEYSENKIHKEEFYLNKETKPKLRRGPGGKGEIFAEKENKFLDFQTPENEVAVAARRDSLQHSYLEPLYQWASKILFYHFGSTLGKNNLLFYAGNAPEYDPRNEEAVIGAYHHAYIQYKDFFDKIILEDMKEIGYYLEDVGSSEIDSAKVNGQLPYPLVGIFVTELDLNSNTVQMDISVGMFRALSLLIQLNYALMSNAASLILVDDIGEGLDYERSCKLIRLLVSKAKDKEVQLVMSTNDRYVMNNVPLEKWTVLHRTGGSLRIFNYENSQEIFDDFKFSGLNNFDFFEYDYLNDIQDEEMAV